MVFFPVGENKQRARRWLEDAGQQPVQRNEPGEVGRDEAGDAAERDGAGGARTQEGGAAANHSADGRLQGLQGEHGVPGLHKNVSTFNGLHNSSVFNFVFKSFNLNL